TPPEPEPEVPATTAATPREERTIDPARRAELREAIRAGRRLVRERKHVEADAQFQRAVALAPESSRLRCEAGYVAFIAGETDRAEQQIGAALAQMPEPDAAPEEVRHQIAMCLFNAGLLYQERGRLADARAVWERSLALRPNGIVERRLRDLGATAEAPADSAALELDPAASFEAYAEQLKAHWCAQGTPGFVPNDAEACAAMRYELLAPEGDGGALQARVVALVQDSFTYDEQFYLVVKTARSALAYDVGSTYSPGAAGISGDLQRVTFAFRDLGATTPTLVLHVTENANDEDMGVCERYGSDRADLYLCGVDDEAPRCSHAPLRRETYFERYTGCEEENGTYVATEEVEGYRVDFTIEEGAVVFTTRRQGEDLPESLTGRRDLAALFVAHPARPVGLDR
ncbi:MAG: hypothetical protein CMN30_09695, partial [Sandaracinus sp.]|nr:hypothetical protein [Sandaracinus sp.]